MPSKYGAHVMTDAVPIAHNINEPTTIQEHSRDAGSNAGRF